MDDLQKALDRIVFVEPPGSTGGRFRLHALFAVIFAAILWLSYDIWGHGGWFDVIWMATTIYGIGAFVARVPWLAKSDFGALAIIIGGIIGLFLGWLYVFLKIVAVVIDLAMVLKDNNKGGEVAPVQLTPEEELVKAKVMDTIALAGKPTHYIGQGVPVDFDFAKTWKTMDMFADQVEECFKTKLIACLWTVDTKAVTELGHPITGLMYKQLSDGIVPIGFEELSTLLHFSIQQKTYGSGYMGHVYHSNGRYSTGEFTRQEKGIIKRVASELGKLDSKQLSAYRDSGLGAGAVIQFMSTNHKVAPL